MTCLLIAWATALLVGCGGPQKPGPAPFLKDPDAGVKCPEGTQIYGRAPPWGEMVFCADPNGTSDAARQGPAVIFKCDECEGGATLHGQFVAGKKDGEWSLLDKEGIRAASFHWTAGKRSGDWTRWYKSGTPHFHRKYDNEGRKDGLEWSNYPNGKRQFEGMWRTDVKHGEWRTYREDGTPESQGFFDNGKKSGEWKVFNAAGKVEKLVYLDDEGKAVREGHMVDGMLQISSLDAQGRKTLTWSEQDGKRHGLLIEYHPDSEIPMRTSTWVLGEQTGPFTLHRADGTKRVGGIFKNGERQCGWRIYDEKGVEVTRAPYYFASLAKAAAALGDALPADACKWTFEHALTVRRGADPAVNIAAARWLFENEVEKAGGETPPEQAPGIQARFEAMQALLERAKAMAAEFKYERAAFLLISAMLEVDRALGGSVLNLAPEANLAGAPTTRGPMPDAAMVKKYRQSARDQLTAIGKLLDEKEHGDKDVRKAGRITIGKIGITKLNFRLFVKAMQ